MGPQDPKDVTRDTARDLSGMAGELAALKADATRLAHRPRVRHPQAPSGGRARSDRGSACGDAQAGEAEREARRINAPSR
jgi:hypothetical protein